MYVDQTNKKIGIGICGEICGGICGGVGGRGRRGIKVMESDDRREFSFAIRPPHFFKK